MGKQGTKSFAHDFFPFGTTILGLDMCNENFFSEIARTKMSALCSQCGKVLKTKYDLYLHTYR